MNLSRLRFCAVAVSRTSSLAPRPAQASQSKPVEPQDALSNAATTPERSVTQFGQCSNSKALAHGFPSCVRVPLDGVVSPAECACASLRGATVGFRPQANVK